MTRIQALKQFAQAVGCKLRVEPQNDGSKDLVLYDGRNEPLVTEFDTHDMEDSIAAHCGSHPAFEDALATYHAAVGEH